MEDQLTDPFAATVVVAVFGGARQTWHAHISSPTGLQHADGTYASPHRSAGVAAAIAHAVTVLDPCEMTVVVSSAVSSSRSHGRTSALERLRTQWAPHGYSIEFVTDTQAVASVTDSATDPAMSREHLDELAATRHVVACDAAFDARDNQAAWVWADRSGTIACSTGPASSSVAAEAFAAASAITAHPGTDLVLLSDCHSVVQHLRRTSPQPSRATSESHWAELDAAVAAHDAKIDAFWIPAHCNFDDAHTAADAAARAALRAARQH